MLQAKTGKKPSRCDVERLHDAKEPGAKSQNEKGITKEKQRCCNLEKYNTAHFKWQGPEKIKPKKNG